jgi:hypothetical protein
MQSICRPNSINQRFPIITKSRLSILPIIELFVDKLITGDIVPTTRKNQSIASRVVYYRSSILPC